MLGTNKKKMKNFIRSLGKWTCIAINILFWGHIMKVGFIALIEWTESDSHFLYNPFLATLSSIVLLGIGTAILRPINMIEYLLVFTFIVQPIILIVPNEYSGFPSPIFDKFVLVDMKTQETIDEGFIKKGCYDKQKLKNSLMRVEKVFCDDCHNGHETRLIVVKNAYYSYRFAELSGYGDSYRINKKGCYIRSLSEFSFVEKILFPLRIASEQSFFYFLRVFFTLCVLMSILDLKGLIPVKYKINMLLIEQSNLYKITSVLIAMILTMNYMYYLEFF
jgi:hypothetical protein